MIVCVRVFVTVCDGMNEVHLIIMSIEQGGVGSTDSESVVNDWWTLSRRNITQTYSLFPYINP